MRRESTTSFHEYCARCKGTTLWVMEPDGIHFKCVGDSRHPERKLPGCGRKMDSSKRVGFEG